ncbi:MAG TPA: phosphatase PAP2 family protein [Chondromyces sp.]|nr:phosphatase PAP2 family protein [Chondromyces sp.]
MNRREKKRTIKYYGTLILLLVGFSWAFAEVVDALRKREVERFDSAVIEFIQSWVQPELTARMTIFTEMGSVWWLTTGTIIITGILLFKRYKDYAIFFVLTVALGGLFNSFLKEMFQRQRPDILPLIEQGGYSFPSGHSMGSAIFYGAVSWLLFELLDRQWTKMIGVIVALGFILLIGMTRIYLGVHYPSDVLGGYIAGAAWLTFSISAFRYFEYRQMNGKRLRQMANERP